MWQERCLCEGMRYLTLAALLVLALPAAAAELILSPSSKLWLEGDSTLHPFSSTATALSVSFLLEAPGPVTAALGAKAPARVTVTVPVASLKSAHEGLDKNLRKALKADKNPAIVFELRSYALKGEAVEAEGELAIAGQRRAAVLSSRWEARDGKLFLEGSQALKMTDFGVAPPSMFMGAVKTKDEVTVRWRLELAPVPVND
jgi:polyisoprenoid-binding protein YceI